ncbi:hypothetical protein EAG_14763 [Camponotus floridanus]|uniref:Uncharacterized protein n=1 Tax=Camponotus floridanus TaxID=104421 RepID=E2A577_CAMFO|nr:hypothetical protein EAG_14763 [Camponotus floridanus]
MAVFAAVADSETNSLSRGLCSHLGGQKGKKERKEDERTKRRATGEATRPASGTAPTRLGKNTERAARASDIPRFRESS